MKKQKIIAMILVFLTVVTVAGIVNANVPTVIGAKKTEAVELMNTTGRFFRKYNSNKQIKTIPNA